MKILINWFGPVILAMIGGVIINYASNGACDTCNIYEYVKYGIKPWGLIGVGMIAFGAIVVIGRVVNALVK